MCGPPDFVALDVCITRLAELSAAGLATYSVCKTATLCRGLRSRRKKLGKSALPNGPGSLAAEGPNGPSNW